MKLYIAIFNRYYDKKTVLMGVTYSTKCKDVQDFRIIEFRQALNCRV
jgi:hypothetical protein